MLTDKLGQEIRYGSIVAYAAPGAMRGHLFIGRVVYIRTVEGKSVACFIKTTETWYLDALGECCLVLNIDTLPPDVRALLDIEDLKCKPVTVATVVSAFPGGNAKDLRGSVLVAAKKPAKSASTSSPTVDGAA